MDEPICKQYLDKLELPRISQIDKESLEAPLSLEELHVTLKSLHGVSFHCYADDTQLYISSRPGETHQIEKLMECIVDIRNWMTSNFLLLNSEKAEVLTL